MSLGWVHITEGVLIYTGAHILGILGWNIDISYRNCEEQ